MRLGRLISNLEFVKRCLPSGGSGPEVVRVGHIEHDVPDIQKLP